MVRTNHGGPSHSPPKATRAKLRLTGGGGKGMVVVFQPDGVWVGGRQSARRRKRSGAEREVASEPDRDSKAHARARERGGGLGEKPLVGKPLVRPAGETWNEVKMVARKTTRTKKK